MYKEIILSVIVFQIFVPAIASAQVSLPPLVTDRPGFTDSGLVVPLGHIQIEGGFSWNMWDKGLRELTGPEILVRWAFAPRFELRIGVPNYVVTELSGGTILNLKSGTGDSSIGAKLQFGPTAGEWDIAAIATISLPTGEGRYTSDAVDPEIILAFARELGGGWSMGTQVSAGFPTSGGERSFIFGGTYVVSTAISAKWSTFYEIAFTVPEEDTAPVMLHTGYAYLISSTLQFDIHGGTGLTNTAPNFFLGAGLSVKK